VIAPAPGDFQVARRKAFEPEARAFDEGDRGGVLRLNVRLEAMQPHGREHVSEDELHALRHIALTDVGLLGVVAKVGALEHSADDLAENEDTKNRSVRDSADDEALHVWLAAAVDPAGKGRRIRGR
jgi:hypothetical protein